MVGLWKPASLLDDGGGELALGSWKELCQPLMLHGLGLSPQFSELLLPHPHTGSILPLPWWRGAEPSQPVRVCFLVERNSRAGTISLSFFSF